MNKLEKQQMVEFLVTLDNRRYIDILAEMEKPHLRGEFYADGDNFILEVTNINIKNYDYCEYYIDLSSDANITFFCELINTKKAKVQNLAIAIKSFRSDICKNDHFTAYFKDGVDSVIRQYGLFNSIKHDIILPETDEIRRLNVDDCDMAEEFSVLNEQHGLPSWELPNFIDCIKHGSDIHRIYGYFRGNILAGFVTTVRHTPKYYCIAYIYTSPEYRQNGIALNLARYYINEFIDDGAFISYGPAQNEASEKTAIAAGFKLFSDTYGYDIKIK